MSPGSRVPGGADAWFATEKVAAGTWLVGESSHVNCFLIEGTDRAVLVDTGLGIADIGRAVRRLTDKPLLVVNTHSHSDHRGGNWRFADVAAHPLAVRSLTQPVAQDHLTAYLEVAREQLAAYQRAREADDRFFHLFTATTRPRPLPEEARGWAVPGGSAPRPRRARAHRAAATERSLIGCVRHCGPTHRRNV